MEKNKIDSKVFSTADLSALWMGQGVADGSMNCRKMMEEAR